MKDLGEMDAADVGRQASKPLEIGRAGWIDILIRTKNEVEKDHMSLVAAGVAFYTFLGIFPCLAVFLSLYSLFSSASEVEQLFSSVFIFLPGESSVILKSEILRLTGQEATAGLGAITGVLFALWSGSKATNGLLEGINIAYEEKQSRGFIKQNIMAVSLTFIGVVYSILCLSLIVVIPAVIKMFPLQENIRNFLNYGRWPILGIMVVLALAVFYRVGPCRRPARFRWISVGSVVASLLWLVASGLFSLYVSNFSSYSKLYGPLSTLVVLMMWFYISAFIILLGAELNAEVEHQTAMDSTIGKDRPVGERGAYVADHIGKHYSKEK